MQIHRCYEADSKRLMAGGALMASIPPVYRDDWWNKNLLPVLRKKLIAQPITGLSIACQQLDRQMTLFGVYEIAT